MGEGLPQSPASTELARRVARYAYDASPSRPSRASSSRSMPVARVKREVEVVLPTSPGRKGKGKQQGGLSDDDLEDERDAAYEEGTPSKKARHQSPAKKAGKKPRPFAGPEVYAHLKPVSDHLTEGLNIVFCGINPGKRSSTMGHHFSHPTNKFWRSLHQSGITPTLLTPQEDLTMPELYSCGLQSELSTLEMRLSVPSLTAKLLMHRPRIVCFVGKKIWDVYESVVVKTAGPHRSARQRQPIELEPGLTTGNDADDDTQQFQKGEKVKVEQAGLDGSAVRLEAPSPIRPMTVPQVKREPPDPVTPVKTPRGRSASASPRKPPMDWHVPRNLRLPHPDGSHTYFWVTPNTSGLERTPLHEQVIIFARLREFSEVLQRGEPDGEFRDIDVGGMTRTVEQIREAAVAKGKVS